MGLSAVHAQPILARHPDTTTVIARHIAGKIDLVMGDLKDDDSVHELPVDVMKARLAADADVHGKERKALNKALDRAFDHMHDQSSDVYSISLVAYEVTDEDGEVLGYGVWGGAPGDIGNARLQIFDADGHKIGQRDEA